MGKIRQTIIGDEEEEKKAKQKAEARRVQKRIEKAVEKTESKVQRTRNEESDNIIEATDATQIDSAEMPTESVKAKKPVKKTADSKYEHSVGKKYSSASALIDKNKTYTLLQAIDLIKKTSFTKFDGTFEAHINTTEKGLRGFVTLPHGTGKKLIIKIADDQIIKNLESGAKIDFDVLVSHPSMMPKLAKVAKILGPRGLMPNPKTGTIGPDPEKLAESLAKGQIQFKTETDFPIIHTIFGKVSFDDKKLEENFQALVKAIGKDKIVSTFLKSTMSPSVRVSL